MKSVNPFPREGKSMVRASGNTASRNGVPLRRNDCASRAVFGSKMTPGRSNWPCAGPCLRKRITPPEGNGDERSRNVIDTQGDSDLSPSQGTKQMDRWSQFPSDPAFTSQERLQPEKYRLHRRKDQNQVAGRNVQKNQWCTELCGGLQAASLRKRKRSRREGREK